MGTRRTSLDSIAPDQPVWLRQIMFEKCGKERTSAMDSNASGTTYTPSMQSGDSDAACLADVTDNIALADPVWLSLDFADADGRTSIETKGPITLPSAPSNVHDLTKSKHERRQYEDIWSTVARARSIVDHRAPDGKDCHYNARVQGCQTTRKGAEANKSCSAKYFSEGSKDHVNRTCKPCAFFHEKGCQSGAACNFCHLCPPREVQRRKRVRRRVAREQLAREEFAAQCSAFQSYFPGFDYGSPMNPSIFDPYAIQWAGSQALTEDAAVNSQDNADE